jgi:hypothetical protein
MAPEINERRVGYHGILVIHKYQIDKKPNL